MILRELSALMVGVAVAGRVASAYAAEVALSVASGEAVALRESGLEPVYGARLLGGRTRRPERSRQHCHCRSARSTASPAASSTRAAGRALLSIRSP